MLRINSNGSRWNGQEPATVDNLLTVLATEPLEPRFLNCGRFIIPLGGGAVRFFGNFYRLSHVFSIDTDEPEVIGRLTAAICDNMASADFVALAQRVERVRDASFRLLEFAQSAERAWGAAVDADEGIDGSKAVDYVTELVVDARRVISKATGVDPLPFVAGERLLEALQKIANDTYDNCPPYRSLGASDPVKSLARAAIAEAEAQRDFYRGVLGLPYDGGDDHGKG